MKKPAYIEYLAQLKIENYAIADLSLLDCFNDTEELPPGVNDMMVSVKPFKSAFLVVEDRPKAKKDKPESAIVINAMLS